MDKSYGCGVRNCGNGKCIHKLLDDLCPCCGKQMVEVVTTGHRFCSGDQIECDYEDESHVTKEPGTWQPDATEIAAGEYFDPVRPDTQSYIIEDWKQYAYAKIGVVRDSMTPEEVEAVQKFLEA